MVSSIIAQSLLETNPPLLEKTRSTGADEAMIPRPEWAKLASYKIGG